MLKKIMDGIAAGIMISIGCAVYLACSAKGELGTYVGAVFFAVALLTICIKGYSLFTGKVGYIPENHSKDAVSTLLLGLLGNAIATCLLGYLLSLAIPTMGETANVICTAKLTQELWQTFIRAIFCGVLMYVAVSIYREGEHGKMSGIFFAVPVFILSGFEHSIANMCYFGASGIVSFDAFLYIVIVILGNSVGGMLLPVVNGKLKINKKKDKGAE
ncbi:MAG: formate/nitrite transporter family protein [Clostridia bacterium]|nr:formate/nitrite transporter family protein [Clostridia bacterium]